MTENTQPGRKGKGGKKEKKQKQAPPPKAHSVWSEAASKSRKDRQARKRQEKLDKLRARREATGVNEPAKPTRLTDAEKTARHGEQEPVKNNSDRKWGLVDFLPRDFVKKAAELLDEQDAAHDEALKMTVTQVGITGSGVHDPAQAVGKETVSITALHRLEDVDPAKAKRSEAAKKAAATRARNLAAAKAKAGRKKKP